MMVAEARWVKVCLARKGRDEMCVDLYGVGWLKNETGLDSHRSRLLPYWHLYMKQTYQYSFYDQRCLFPQGCPAYVVTCLATDSAAIIHFKYRSLSETKSEMTPTPINQSFI